MKLRVERVTEFLQEMDKIERLYCAAFPENERKPLGPLLRDSSGHGEILAFYEDSCFCGFACLLTNEDISHIIYFAIEETLRGKGYGSQALDAMKKQKAGMRIIADIEVEDCQKENSAQRHARRLFYQRNGFEATKIQYEWCQEWYEIVSCGGDISSEEFEAFWNEIYDASEALRIY